MSEEKKTQCFSIDTPDGLIRTLGVVRLLIDGTEEEIARVPMSGYGDGRSFQNALDHAQRACPKVDWVRKARVNWLLRGIQNWEGELIRLQEDGVSLAKISSPNRFALYCPVNPTSRGLMDHQVFMVFITMGYIGIDCNSMMDRYLKLLRQVAELTGNNYWRNDMVHLILRRTGCNRDDDPHRDEAACRALLLQYGLEEHLPGLDKSRPEPQRTA